MHFHTYLEIMLERHKKTRKEFYEHPSINVGRSSVSHWLAERRMPDHNMLKAAVEYFTKSKTKQAKHLHYIYFGGQL